MKSKAPPKPVEPVSEQSQKRRDKILDSLEKFNYSAASLGHIHYFSESVALTELRALAALGKVETFVSRNCTMWRLKREASEKTSSSWGLRAGS